MLYFTGRLKADIKLTGIQQSILLAVGLQRKDLTAIEQELSLPSSQLLAMFIKIMRKLSAHFTALVSGAIEAEMPKTDTIGVSQADASGAFDDELVDKQFVPLETGLEEELEEGGDEALKELREKQRELIDALPLDQYETPHRRDVIIANEITRFEIEEGASGWADAERQVLNATKEGQTNPVVSIKTSKKRKPVETAAQIYEEEMGEKVHKKAKKASKKEKHRS